MADKKISQLTAASTPLAGTEVLPIVQSGATKKVTALELTGTTLDAFGNVTIPEGNLVQGTAAKGVNFTANTTAAGMTSQLLNWYEEGTWTPALAYTTPGTSAFTYSTQRGYYTRVGRNVTLNCVIRLATFSKGTASGVLTITGIPFTSSGLADCIATGNLGLYDAPFTGVPVALISSSSSVISLLQLSSNAGWSSINDPDADSQYIVVITYTV